MMREEKDEENRYFNWIAVIGLKNVCLTPISCCQIQISSFPERVEKLSLKGCDLYNITSDRTYLFKINLHMEHLTVRAS